MVLAFLTALSITQTVGSLYDGPIDGTDQGYGVYQNGNTFTNVPCNTAATTDGIKVKGYRWVEYTVRYTFGAASAVTAQCDQSEDGLIWASIEGLTLSGNTGASSPFIWSEAVTASRNWTWVIPNHGVYQRCKFTCTGGSTSDTLSLNARGGV